MKIVIFMAEQSLSRRDISFFPERAIIFVQNSISMRLLLVFGIAFLSTLALAQDSFKIKGRVLDSVRELPIEFVTVVLKTKEGASLSGTTTTKDGNFELTSDLSLVEIEFRFMGFETM